jgi:hypothetical protein
MVEEIKVGKVSSLPSNTKRGKGGSSKLHPREVMLIRRLWFWGWSDEQIWKEYHIPFPVIQKAKNERERQATEEFDNKEQHAVELARFKE